LISNAFYAINERAKQGETDYQPKVTILTKTNDNQIVIQVQDNGTGIPDSIKAKIFQPFFTTKPTGEGTGLGLSLAYDIVTKGHGGTLEVESMEGAGTTFAVKLPIA
jgi:two-component system NtrC family sensor kinase